MIRKVAALIAALALQTVFAAAAMAIPTTLIDQGSVWQYQQFRSPDLWPTWNTTTGYNSFDWEGATWSTGGGAFGNGHSLPYNTYWQSGTDLALQQAFTIPSGPINGPLTLNVAADNGFILFINGTQVAKENAEGYTSIWEYTLSLDNSPFIAPGENIIQVLAEDHGAKTYFDMKLTGDLPASPVPEPTSLLLVGAGLVGLTTLRRRRKSL